MSLTMTAHLKLSSVCLVSRMCFSKVVFPEPRNPQSRVTGTRPSPDPAYTWHHITLLQFGGRIIIMIFSQFPLHPLPYWPVPVSMFLSVCDATRSSQYSVWRWSQARAGRSMRRVLSRLARCTAAGLLILITTLYRALVAQRSTTEKYTMRKESRCILYSLHKIRN